MAANAAAGKQKRERKPKPVEGAINAKRVLVRRRRKTGKVATGHSTLAIDEITDILQLEEENQRLRKLTTGSRNQGFRSDPP
jgi:aminoglycoside phosphotransferase family enzyme